MNREQIIEVLNHYELWKEIAKHVRIKVTSEAVADEILALQKEEGTYTFKEIQNAVREELSATNQLTQMKGFSDEDYYALGVLAAAEKRLTASPH